MKLWIYLNCRSVKEDAIVAVTLLLTKMHLAFAIHHGRRDMENTIAQIIVVVRQAYFWKHRFHFLIQEIYLCLKIFLSMFFYSFVSLARIVY